MKYHTPSKDSVNSPANTDSVQRIKQHDKPFVNNRPQALLQLKLQNHINNTRVVRQLKKNGLTTKQLVKSNKVVQRMKLNNGTSEVDHMDLLTNAELFGKFTASGDQMDTAIATIDSLTEGKGETKEITELKTLRSKIDHKRKIAPSEDIDKLKAIAKEVYGQWEKEVSAGKLPDYIKKIVENTVDTDGSRYYQLPGEEDRSELNKIVHLHGLLQEKLGPEGVGVLARFYVDNETVGSVHPGLNSWAYLKSSKEPETLYAEKEKGLIDGLAQSHMKYGHDIKGKNSGSETGVNGVQMGSPLVSATANIGEALLADSAFNTKIMMALMASHKDEGGASSSQVGGKFYSQRIDRLMYGHGDAKANELLFKSAPVANKIAFVAVNNKSDHIYSRGTSCIGAEDNDCCTLENEVTVYAPITNLNDVKIAEIDNPLPSLKGSGKLKPKPASTRRY